ncbi:hypothetical protein BP00DRAFT_214915 [Aspergillus indologenus CBS 114.80]|uniref:Secreted protein n=1 Tax=Aspergillus indologenus CBS 114.80 TaxID=1450541 RepID=A0A2V5I4W3_9EURO|nr:hypothetical protein BP00DRAFT_214915 [Aspergillus indologenus CBS 114.80]
MTTVLMLFFFCWSTALAYSERVANFTAYSASSPRPCELHLLHGLSSSMKPETQFWDGAFHAFLPVSKRLLIHGTQTRVSPAHPKLSAGRFMVYQSMASTAVGCKGIAGTEHRPS